MDETTNNARDTQFSGFAKALVYELTKPEIVAIGMRIDDFRDDWEKIIARRAYDLAKHTMSHVGQGMAAENEGGPKYLEENMRCIPDMPELPKEQE